MTNWLIRSSSCNHPSSLVRAKVECCKLLDHFDCWIKDYSAARIPFSSITGHYPQPTGGLVVCGGRGVLPLCSGAVGFFYSLSQQGGFMLGLKHSICVSSWGSKSYSQTFLPRIRIHHLECWKSNYIFFQIQLIDEKFKHKNVCVYIYIYIYIYI